MGVKLSVRGLIFVYGRCLGSECERLAMIGCFPWFEVVC